MSSKNRPEKPNLLAFGADCSKKGKNVILVSSRHFNDTINLDSQKPDIIEHYNQTNQELTLDHITDTYNVARDIRRWPMVIFYTILNIAGINARTIAMLNSNMKIRHRILNRNLVMWLVSEKIKRRSEISTGVHKPLHLKLQFQTQI